MQMLSKNKRPKYSVKELAAVYKVPLKAIENCLKLEEAPKPIWGIRRGVKTRYYDIVIAKKFLDSKIKQKRKEEHVNG